MRIETVEPRLIGRYAFVVITTDSGLTGLGEAGIWGYPEIAAAGISRMGDYLVGKDPLRIEHHWQYIYRSHHFRGAGIMAALSAIDIALWDIAGKHYGAPVHALLGGPVRDKARLYAGHYAKAVDAAVEGIRSAREAGFTAVGHLSPFGDGTRSEPFDRTHVQKVNEAVAGVGAFREAAGPDVDLCIEIHRRFSPYEAVQFCNAIGEHTPLFVEDPITPDNVDEMAYVVRSTAVPIATGERLTSLWDFQMLLQREAAQMIRPDVALVGGISGMRKIAALAEACHVGVVPHAPLSAVTLAASLQVAAAIPNFVVQEFPPHAWLDEARPHQSSIIDGVPVHDGNGYAPISDAPGIGVTLKPDAETTLPYERRRLFTRLAVDGSVVDQ